MITVHPKDQIGSSRCVYCHSDVSEASDGWDCPACHTVYHAECAAELRHGCAAFGCATPLRVRGGTASASPTPRPALPVRRVDNPAWRAVQARNREEHWTVAHTVRVMGAGVWAALKPLLWIAAGLLAIAASSTGHSRSDRELFEFGVVIVVGTIVRPFVKPRASAAGARAS